MQKNNLVCLILQYNNLIKLENKVLQFNVISNVIHIKIVQQIVLFVNKYYFILLFF